MTFPKTISHEGTIVEIKDTSVIVNIVSASACSACHAKGACLVSDTENKLIEVESPQATYHVGEQVRVVMEESSGYKALFGAYLFPFILLMFTLVVVSKLSPSEIVAGLAGVGVLTIYYLGLYLYREKIKKNFTFRIEKLN